MILKMEMPLHQLDTTCRQNASTYPARGRRYIRRHTCRWKDHL